MFIFNKIKITAYYATNNWLYNDGEDALINTF